MFKASLDVSGVWYLDEKFFIKRFRNDCKLLNFFCKDDVLPEWSNHEDFGKFKSDVYRGCFINCIESLFSFIPLTFKKYCEYYENILYKDLNFNRSARHAVEVAGANNFIDFQCSLILSDIFRIRNAIIHHPLDGKYYDNIRDLVGLVRKIDFNILINEFIYLYSLALKAESRKKVADENAKFNRPKKSQGKKNKGNVSRKGKSNKIREMNSFGEIKDSLDKPSTAFSKPKKPS